MNELPFCMQHNFKLFVLRCLKSIASSNYLPLAGGAGCDLWDQRYCCTCATASGSVTWAMCSCAGLWSCRVAHTHTMLFRCLSVHMSVTGLLSQANTSTFQWEDAGGKVQTLPVPVSVFPLIWNLSHAAHCAEFQELPLMTGFQPLSSLSWSQLITCQCSWQWDFKNVI